MTMTKPTFTDEFKQGITVLRNCKLVIDGIKKVILVENISEVVQYVLDHPNESKVAVAKKFGIADSTVHKWLKDANNNDGIINSRGSGNYSSDEAKEIARLKKN